MPRLIDADKLIEKAYWHGDTPSFEELYPEGHDAVDVEDIDDAPTVDAIPVKVVKSWLYSIAMNNVDNSLGDACEEIILRLNGLVRYNADWKDGETDGR